MNCKIVATFFSPLLFIHPFHIVFEHIKSRLLYSIMIWRKKHFWFVFIISRQYTCRKAVQSTLLWLLVNEWHFLYFVVLCLLPFKLLWCVFFSFALVIICFLLYYAIEYMVLASGLLGSFCVCLNFSERL